MDRAILLFAGTAWCLAGLAGVGVAVVGLDALRALLPPLSIDAPALGRTVAALAAGSLALGGVHLGLGVGLGRGRAWATSGGVLLAGMAVAAFVTGASAAVTAGVAGTLTPLAAIGAAAGCIGSSVLYGLAGWSLVRRLRSGNPS